MKHIKSEVHKSAIECVRKRTVDRQYSVVNSMPNYITISDICILNCRYQQFETVISAIVWLELLISTFLLLISVT